MLPPQIIFTLLHLTTALCRSPGLQGRQLIIPLWRVLKEKAKVMNKHKFQRECVWSEVTIKGQRCSPVRFTTKWNLILHKCGTKLTEVLVDHHEVNIAQLEFRAAQVIQKGFLELIPQWITEYPNINAILKGVVKM